MANYWLHRITGGENAVKLSHPLLFEHGILSTGWARCSWDDFVKKSKGGWETFLQEFGYEYPALGNYRSLWNFLQMQEGDIVVVPTRGEFSIYRVVDYHVYTNESLSSIIRKDKLIDEEGKTAYVDKDKKGYSYLFDADGEFIDLGFYRKVCPIAEHLSRDLCDATLRNYLGNPRTNININEIATHVDIVINNINSMAHIRLDRTFWPVGHGAFYTETFRNDDHKPMFTAVYDCGSGNNMGKTIPTQNGAAGAHQRQSPPFIASKADDFINTLKTDNQPVPNIDIVFVSHFHADHINGLPHLLPHVKRLVLPQLCNDRLLESFLYNAIVTDDGQLNVDSEAQRLIIQLAEKNLRFEGREEPFLITEVIPSDEERNRQAEREEKNRHVDANSLGNQLISGTPIKVDLIPAKVFSWLYIPVNVDYDANRADAIITEIQNNTNRTLRKNNGDIDWLELCNAVKMIGLDGIIEIYKRHFGIIDPQTKKEYSALHNTYSMPVFSGPYSFTPEMDFHADVYYEPVDMYWHVRHYYHALPIPMIGSYMMEPLCKLSSCLYMGDFCTNEGNKFEQLKSALETYYYRAGLQQVPHHFSDKGNHRQELYVGRLFAFGNVTDAKDPSFSRTICDHIRYVGCSPLVITKDKYSIVILHYNFF